MDWICPSVVSPSLARLSLVFWPMPQTKRTGLSARNARVSALPITEKPRGLLRSEAILARNLLWLRPIETVMPISRSIFSARRARLSAGAALVQRLGAGEVEERFVDRERLHQRRQFEHQRADLLAGLLIFRHVRRAG